MFFFFFFFFFTLGLDSKSIKKLKRRVNGPIPANAKSTLEMGQSLALKLQSLLDVLYLEHILDTVCHFIGVIRTGTCKK